MKKFLAIFLSLLMVLSLAACAGNGGSDDNEDDEKSKASDEKDKDDEKDTDAESGEATEAPATEATATEAPATEAPTEKATEPATEAPAPSAETLEFYGVTLNVPDGFTAGANTDTNKTFSDDDGSCMLGLTVMSNVTYDAIMSAYTPEELISTLLQGNGEIQEIEEETINGKKTISALVQMPDDDGNIGVAAFQIIFFADHAVVIMAAASQDADPNAVDALEEALNEMTF